MPTFTIEAPTAGVRMAHRVGASLPGGSELFGLGPGDGAAYEDALRQAFQFMRRNDGGRYSSVAKMRVLRAAEDAEGFRTRGFHEATLPGLVGVRSPYRFDEDTEVKSGGMVAVAVVWPHENGKVMLAVHPTARRTGMARLLIKALGMLCGVHTLTAWVNKGNVGGQHFLLSQGFAPTSFNNQGGVAWTFSNEAQSADGVEDHIDPLYASPLVIQPYEDDREEHYDYDE